MSKVCKYPVRKWKDIPYETKERIKRELAIPLPEHLKRVPSTLKIREKKKNFPLLMVLGWSTLILLILLSLSLFLN
jgi:hypothetical protein